MEVTIPQFLPQGLDFSDPRVLFQESRKGDQDFVKFLEDETSQLRALFVGINPENRGAYEHFFDSSTTSSLVKNTLEIIWYEQLDFDDLRKGVLQLEERRNDFPVKFDEYERDIDIDELPTRTVTETGRQKIKHMYPEVKDFVTKLDEDTSQLLRRIRNMDMSWHREMERKQSISNHVSRNITPGGLAIQLQGLLVNRQMQASLSSRNEIKFFWEKMDRAQRFVVECLGWLCEALKVQTVQAACNIELVP